MNLDQLVIQAMKLTKTQKFNLEEFLFKEQIDFVKDPAKYSVATCSVRAGKTTACAADLIDTAFKKPGTTGIYITLARTSAEAIVWPELQRIIHEYEIEANINLSKLTINLSNGSWIRLYGGNEEKEIEKIRGLSNVALVYIDEAQAFRPHIKELVENIIAKRLYDTNGRCRLIGTPGPTQAGYFFECSNNPLWSTHHWTMHSNPWLFKKSGKTPQELIDEDCARRGVTIDDPSIQRECYGKWVRDDNALLLSFDHTKNHYDSLPEDVYSYILGIDLGVNDSDSLSVLAYSDASPVTWLVEEILTPNQLTDNLAAQIRSLESKYGSMQMVADTGGLGKKVVMDLMYRYGFVITAADKQKKIADYAFLNNALRTGMFKAKKETIFAKDCDILQKDRDKSTPDKIIVKGHSDAVDSVLYAFALSPAYDYKPAKFKALPGTPEYIREQEELHKEALIERMKRDNAQSSGDNLYSFPKVNGKDPWHNW
jgi:phage terminase large subunit